MACLTDLINLDLSDTTEKIIAEYIWYGRVAPSSR
jgi:glutamine synthetase